MIDWNGNDKWTIRSIQSIVGFVNPNANNNQSTFALQFDHNAVVNENHRQNSVLPRIDAQETSNL